MLPIKLTLEGIYSYRERQTIDFTRLTGARLFGIFGPVGSGKSTILEAMIYAIYGTIDRLNNEVKYNLMNLQSDRLFVDFEFRAGEEGKLFRATVECRRNKKKFTDVSSPKYLYHAWEGDEWIPCTREEVVDAIGLNVQNFKRVVIIPQGKFQEFLLLRDKERTDMMMELFGELRRYDLGGRVAYLEGETTRRAIDLRGQLTGLGEVNEETLAEQKMRYAALRGEAEKLEADVIEGQKREEKLRKVKQLVDELEARRQEELALRDQEPEFKSLQSRVDQYDRFVQHFQQPLNRYDDTERRMTEAVIALGDYREKLKEKQKELDRFTVDFNRLKGEYESREDFKERADRLSVLLRLRTIRGELKDLQERHAKGEKLVIDGKKEIEEARELLNDRKNDLEKVRQSMPDMKVLSDIREWYNIQQHLKGEFTRLQQEFGSVEQDLERERRDIESLQKLHPAFDTISPLIRNTLETACREERQRVEATIKAAREEWMHQNTRQRLVDFAKELSEGEPCPLCGALSHPAPLHAAEIQGDLKEKTARIQTLENELKILDQVASRLEVIAERWQLTTEKSVRLDGQLKIIRERLKAHLTLFTWDKYPSDNFEVIMAEIDKSARLDEKKRELEKSCKLAEETIEKKRVDVEKYVARLDEINREVVQRCSLVELLQGQLAGFDATAYERAAEPDIKKESDDCRERFERIGREYQRDFEKLRLIESEYRKYEGSVEEKDKEVTRLQREFETCNNLLLASLRDSAYKDVEALREFQKRSSLNVPEARDKIRHYERQLHALVVRVAELRALLDGVSYDPKEYKALVGRNDELRARECVLLAEIGAVGNRLKDMETRVAARVKIGKALEGLELRLSNLQVLKALFRGNDFVKFVSSIYLQNLCNAANERFYRMTRQRLKLELSEDNDFVVRDYMNEGRTRSARTLSGGQIFQASLSLALALTDNIRHLTGSNQNFFFLDEGFGSLDRESLGVVFDTLKSLRAENRVVGLISHVEEMQQEIPACLFVENSAERGSVITIEN